MGVSTLVPRTDAQAQSVEFTKLDIPLVGQVNKLLAENTQATFFSMENGEEERSASSKDFNKFFPDRVSSRIVETIGLIREWGIRNFEDTPEDTIFENTLWRDSYNWAGVWLLLKSRIKEGKILRNEDFPAGFFTEENLRSLYDSQTRSIVDLAFRRNYRLEVDTIEDLAVLIGVLFSGSENVGWSIYYDEEERQLSPRYFDGYSAVSFHRGPGKKGIICKIEPLNRGRIGGQYESEQIAILALMEIMRAKMAASRGK